MHVVHAAGASPPAQLARGLLLRAKLRRRRGLVAPWPTVGVASPPAAAKVFQAATIGALAVAATAVGLAAAAAAAAATPPRGGRASAFAIAFESATLAAIAALSPQPSKVPAELLALWPLPYSTIPRNTRLPSKVC